MEKANSWDLLRGSKAEQQTGLLQCQRDYFENPNGSNTMSLGVAYMFLHEYQLAWEHFRRVIQSTGAKGDVYFGMAGVAMWCLNRPSDAIAEWRSGLKANYSRAGGLNIRIPLLLFFASMINSSLYEKASAADLLLKKSNDQRIKNWPGPIASFLLGKISDTDLTKLYGSKAVPETLGCQWLEQFYKSVAKYQPSGSLQFRSSMEKLSDMKHSEWANHDYFLDRVWSEEFFLARYEACADINHEKAGSL